MGKVTKNLVHAKARVLGVLHKLDPIEDDQEYLTKWDILLDKFREFKNKCNLGERNASKNICLSSITEADIRHLKTDQKLYDDVLSSLHEDHNGEFPEPKGFIDDDVIMSQSNNVCDKYGKYVTEDVHIIDVDYEYDSSTGMNIILYTRIIGSDDTIFVRVPYHDYFYIEITEEMPFDKIKKAIDGYCFFLKNKYKSMEKNPNPNMVDFRKHPINMDLDSPLVIKMEIVEDLKSMYNYQPDPQRFVKITTANPTITQDLFNGLSKKYVGDVIESYKWVNGVRTEDGKKYFPEMKFYEASKTDVTNKFLTQYGISGCCAVRVEGYRLETNIYSTCTIAINASNVVNLPDAPFYEPRTFFYDIECLALDINEFPTSDKCPIIQISYVCVKGRDIVSKGVLCLEETPGYESFEDEDTMLIMFAKKIVDFNPDYLTGFNSNSFDMPYIIDRMKVLGVYDIAGQFSRRKNFLVPYKRDFKQSKQFGTKEVVKYTTPGRVMFDQMDIIKGNPMIRLRSYSLKSICSEFLTISDKEWKTVMEELGEEFDIKNDTKLREVSEHVIANYPEGSKVYDICDLYLNNNKEDLKYRDIPDLFMTPEGRQKIASYCLQDSMLLKKLDDKTMLGVDIAGQAKVQGITPNVVLNRGLVHRIMCKIKQYTERYKFLIPTFSKTQFPVSPTYQGATVLNCDAGYYTDPVVVLDFASLYPSLIRSYNLDYTTIAKDKAQVQKYPERFQIFDNGYAFVKNEYQRGLLPRIEAELAVERKNAKKKMKNAKDDVEHAVWNAIQGGVKIVMNSIYGLAGSPTATVPCVPIASTITYLGRLNLGRSKEYVEANFCRITGEPEERKARVIYGDTVSLKFLQSKQKEQTILTKFF
jgi:DNA polymerase delta subunit 1